MNPEQILSTFAGWLEGPDNEHLRTARQEGTPLMGYTCTYVPPEVISAAGCVPVRIRGAGSPGAEAADALMSSRTCSLIRHVMALALDGAYDHLDGQVSCNSCDHVRRSSDVWRHKTGLGFHGFLSVPRNVRDSLYGFYRQEVRNLLTGLEAHLQIEVGVEALRNAIRLHNRVRRVLARLDAMRAEEPARLTGSQVLCASVAARLVPPETFAELGEALVDGLEFASPREKPVRARLLLTGGELDEPAWMELIERQGAAVVADGVCFSTRAEQGLVDELHPDPMEAICRHTFFQTACARMIGNFPDRVVTLNKLVSRRRVDGVVLQRLKFCDPWGGEAHNLRRRCREQDLPLLVLEREYGRQNAGQVSTRVQAFLELLESRARRGRRSSEQAELGHA